MAMKIVEIKTEQVTRDYVVEQFGEEVVQKMERDWMLGVKRPLVKHSIRTRIRCRIIDIINSLLKKLGGM